jgi:hypothetical protein
MEAYDHNCDWRGTQDDAVRRYDFGAFSVKMKDNKAFEQQKALDAICLVRTGTGCVFRCVLVMALEGQEIIQ